MHSVERETSLLAPEPDDTSLGGLAANPTFIRSSDMRHKEGLRLRIGSESFGAIPLGWIGQSPKLAYYSMTNLQ